MTQTPVDWRTLPWLAGKPTHTTPAGLTVPVVTSADLYQYTDEIRAADAAKARLGCLAVMLDGAGLVQQWVYCSVRDPPSPIGANYRRPEPPPLPQPRANWVACGCSHGHHVCTSCGEPYWVEIHGMGDGSCGYCYRRG